MTDQSVTELEAGIIAQEKSTDARLRTITNYFLPSSSQTEYSGGILKVRIPIDNPGRGKTNLVLNLDVEKSLVRLEKELREQEGPGLKYQPVARNDSRWADDEGRSPVILVDTLYFELQGSSPVDIKTLFPDNQEVQSMKFVFRPQGQSKADYVNNIGTSQMHPKINTLYLTIPNDFLGLTIIGHEIGHIADKQKHPERYLNENVSEENKAAGERGADSEAITLFRKLQNLGVVEFDSKFLVKTYEYYLHHGYQIQMEQFVGTYPKEPTLSEAYSSQRRREIRGRK